MTYSLFSLGKAYSTLYTLLAKLDIVLGRTRGLDEGTNKLSYKTK